MKIAALLFTLQGLSLLLFKSTSLRFLTGILLSFFILFYTGLSLPVLLALTLSLAIYWGFLHWMKIPSLKRIVFSLLTYSILLVLTGFVAEKMLKPPLPPLLWAPFPPLFLLSSFWGPRIQEAREAEKNAKPVTFSSVEFIIEAGIRGVEFFFWMTELYPFIVISALAHAIFLRGVRKEKAGSRFFSARFFTLFCALLGREWLWRM